MKYNLMLILSLVSRVLLAQSFEKVENAVTTPSGSSRAATFVDIDGDGWLDIFVTNGKKGGDNNELYMNDGAGGFERDETSIITRDQSQSDGATWGDTDNDGDLDLYVVTWYGAKNYYYTSNGSAYAINNSINTSGYSETASWVDYDKDGYLDLYVTNSSNGTGSPNQFFHNLGDGNFAVEQSLSITKSSKNSRSVNWIDYDNDNDLDLFVSNEGAQNELYLNDDGEYVLQSNLVTTYAKNSTGSSWADYDNDGDLDLYVANYAQTNELYQNNGDGTFMAVSSSPVVTGSNYSFGTAWGDIDNDGDLDLFVANGFKSGTLVANNLYFNNGDGTFTEDTDHLIVEETGWSFGAAFGDYDNDGFLDLLVANTYNESQKNSLYHNLGNDNNWIILDLEGAASNRSAIGAKVKVTATINGESITQLREISSQSCYNGQNSMRAHFGLGDANSIDEVEIVWPLGNVETFNDIEINQIKNVTEAIPSDFVRANFTLGDQKVGIGENIDLIDLSVYAEESEVSYEWDFDNDGEIDSFSAIPEFSYQEAGTYSIRLVIKLGEQIFEKIRTDYINVIDPSILSVSPEMDAVMIYPNPVVDRLNFDTDFDIKTLKIIDIHGKAYVELTNQKTRSTSMDVSSLNLKPGVYHLILNGVNETQSVKFLIKE